MLRSSYLVDLILHDDRRYDAYKDFQDQAQGIDIGMDIIVACKFVDKLGAFVYPIYDIERNKDT